ncbi:MAG: hypothetical protein Q4F39_00640 [Bacteroidia bacterium]|nr:hypothetical protein [Bacteroidia bacterium]
MKKIISIAFAAILAGLAISCQKENSFSVNTTDSVQYSFNITVNEQFGFDSDVSTKGGVSPSYKTAWANGDRIFLFFKPTSGSLLTDTYATLTYDGSTWGGAVTGTSSLGEGGKLSAVYVYNLDGSVTPEFSTDKWTVATGNVFYNCQADVSYTVSGDEITASLNLVAPADFVRFSVVGASGQLTCDKVKGWKDIAIGSDLAVSNVTNTGYMEGFTNSGPPNVMDYYGRLVSGTSLNGISCKFSVVKEGKVYEHTAAPTSNARSFQMSTSAWAEAPGKLPGLFSVAADGKVIRFSKGNLRYTTGNSTWSFFVNQYEYGHSNDQVSLFTWGYGIDWSTNPSTSTYLTTHTTGEILAQSEDWGSKVGSEGTWRTLTTAEWQYLFNYDSRVVVMR